MVKGNPFLSPTFTKIWQKYFIAKKPLLKLDIIEGPLFVRHSIFPFLFSCGGYDTKGLHYKVIPENIKGFNGQVILIYDIQSGINFDNYDEPTPLSRKVVKQYPGYIVDLTSFDSFEKYMSTVFSGKSRRKLFSYKNKMERELSTTTKMYFGQINETEYCKIFDVLYDILKKRFHYKKESNHILDETRWKFYKELIYELLLEKKASIFVVSQDHKPICVMLNFIHNKTIIGALTGFDMDYQTYNVGTIGMMQQIEWAFANKFDYIDFSKGEYEYKKRWGSTPYNFEYHILFDKKSVKARFIALCMCKYFELKQLLRQKGLNDFMHQLVYKLS